MQTDVQCACVGLSLSLYPWVCAVLGRQGKKDKKGEDAVREVPNLHKEQLLSILETICTQMGQVVVRPRCLHLKDRPLGSLDWVTRR